MIDKIKLTHFLLDINYKIERLNLNKEQADKNLAKVELLDEIFREINSGRLDG